MPGLQITQICEGTNEIQRLVIARTMTRTADGTRATRSQPTASPRPFRRLGVFAPYASSGDESAGAGARMTLGRARVARLSVAGVWRDDAVRRYARGPSRTGRVMSWLTNGFWAYCGSPASSIAG